MKNKCVKIYGSYRKPIEYRKYSRVMECVVLFYAVDEINAKVVVESWNGRGWRPVGYNFCTKEEANEIAKKIIKTNVITEKEAC